MSNFIGYTVGLEASNGDTSKLVKVEYTRNSDQTVSLKAVSGRTQSATKGSAIVTAEQFSNRPQDPYNNIAEARWALKLCGWSIETAGSE